MEFYVNLIVTKKEQTKKALKSLKGNCTKICDNVYFMEGDVSCLCDDEVIFNLMDEDLIVGSLGGLTEKKLIKMCEDDFGIDVKKFKYNIKTRYKEE